VNRSKVKRDVGILLALLVVHQILKYAFADGALGRALFSPNIAGSAPTLLAGVVLLNVRVLLVVGVPGVLGALGARAVFTLVSNALSR
jgi:hypothetical protein